MRATPVSHHGHKRDVTDVSEEVAWKAVMARDAAFDGRFVYAVSTTSVFCRPGCASRRPRREHVTFFATPAAAEAAGYRACRRCRPTRPAEPSKAARAIVRVKTLIDSHVDSANESPLTLRALASAVRISPFHLQRQFTRLMGASPRAYAAARRADRLKARLREGDTVTEATYEAGYGSSRAAYEQGVRALGMTPATYGRGGFGVHISYGTAQTPFGRLLVAATDRGVCSVMLGDEVHALERALEREFPKATIGRSDDALAGWIGAIVRSLEGEPALPDLPLDVRGSAFQHRVWRALQMIPYGQTRSYAEVAATIGSPSAARAVAQACATNPVALVVPCHRVVRADGAPGGYRWGAARKRTLLTHERQARPLLDAVGQLKR